VKVVLTIAGHDLSNGAGITKDLEVFASFGFHGLSVPTCFVVQGPRGASAVSAVSSALFAQMLGRAGTDFAADGIKIGVLPGIDHVDSLLDFLTVRPQPAVVLDPVMAAKNGLTLMSDETLRIVRERLLPRLSCITPNLDEASRLLNKDINDLSGMEWAARALVDRGAMSAIVKGGHLAGNPVDLFFDGDRVTTHEKRRIARNVHGTGCLFSSALLSFLVLGYPIAEAFLRTEHTMELLFRESIQPLDKGYFYAHPVALVARGGGNWWDEEANDRGHSTQSKR
jgi:hydroxymethylpyrimidine kinase/phosphomethylpyrimidine kinase